MQDQRVQSILSGIDKRVQAHLEANNQILLETLKDSTRKLRESIEKELVANKERLLDHGKFLAQQGAMFADVNKALEKHSGRISSFEEVQKKQDELLETWEQVLFQMKDNLGECVSALEEQSRELSDLDDNKADREELEELEKQYASLLTSVEKLQGSLDNTAATLISTNDTTHQRLEEAFGCMGVIGEQIVAETKKTTQKFDDTNKAIEALKQRCDTLEQQKDTLEASVEAAKASVLDSTQSLVSAAAQHVLGAVSATQECLETTEENVKHLSTGLQEIAGSVVSLSSNLVQLAKSTSERAGTLEESHRELVATTKTKFENQKDWLERLLAREENRVFEIVDEEGFEQRFPAEIVQYFYTDNARKPLATRHKAIYVLGLFLLLVGIAPLLATHSTAGLAIMAGFAALYHAGVQAMRPKTELQVTYKLKTERRKHKVLVRRIKYPNTGA